MKIMFKGRFFHLVDSNVGDHKNNEEITMNIAPRDSTFVLLNLLCVIVLMNSTQEKIEKYCNYYSKTSQILQHKENKVSLRSKTMFIGMQQGHKKIKNQ